MSDQRQGQQQGQTQQSGQWQQPQTRDERQRMQQERNAFAQRTGGGEERVDMEQLESMIKAEYANVDQPGLHPANRPSGSVEGQRDPHKSTRDLEDITGNPGHRGINPNAPANSMNPMPSPTEGYPSINEPPGSNVLPPMQEQRPQGEQRRLGSPQQDVFTPPPPPPGWQPY